MGVGQSATLRSLPLDQFSQRKTALLFVVRLASAPHLPNHQPWIQLSPPTQWICQPRLPVRRPLDPRLCRMLCRPMGQSIWSSTTTMMTKLQPEMPGRLPLHRSWPSQRLASRTHSLIFAEYLPFISPLSSSVLPANCFHSNFTCRILMKPSPLHILRTFILIPSHVRSPVPCFVTAYHLPALSIRSTLLTSSTAI